MVKMTYFEAALKVLEKANGGPLHYAEITKRAIQAGYITPAGETPEASLGANLYVHIKESMEQGVEPKVRRVGRGQFLLASKPTGFIQKAIEDANKKSRNDLKSRLHEMHPRAFEHLCSELFYGLGFENVNVTKYSQDGGIDIDAELTVGGVTNVKTAIQVKRWKKNVDSKTVTQLRGSIKTDQRGLIVTLSSYTKSAIKEAAEQGKSPISLINGDQFLDLLIRKEIGVKRQNIDFIELDLDQLSKYDEIDATSPTGKSLGLWPLPGGIDQYVETTIDMLKYATLKKPTMREMTKWIIKEYSDVTSEKTCRGYMNVLRTLDLIKYDGERVIITKYGEEVLTGDASEIILGQLFSHVVGIEELMKEFEIRSMTLDESHNFLLKQLNIKWKTNIQTIHRLRWLLSTGVITRDNDIYRLS